MFACLYLGPEPASSKDATGDGRAAALLALAREFSPRVDEEAPGVVTVDIAGLGRLLGSPRAIGDQLRKAASDRHLPAHVAIARTRTAAALLASAHAGLLVVPPGEEAVALAPLPLEALRQAGGWQLAGPEQVAQAPSRRASDLRPMLEVLRRWGLRTLGQFAALPPVALFERLGQEGVRWQRLARGEDLTPLVSDAPDRPFEATLALEWPIEGLEPLSFVFGRLFEELCDRLTREDQAAAVLHVALRLVTRDTVTRTLQLPAPMRDGRTLRTLILLELEARPVAAGIDRVTVRVDTAPGRSLQRSLLSRALPAPEQLSTLVARLSALAGEGCVGGARLVDSYRPDAFEMVAGGSWVTSVGATEASRVPGPRWRVADWPLEGGRYGAPLEAAGHAPSARLVLRRFRWPVPARVLVQQGQPVRVATDRRGLEGGRVEAAAGPWRTSGEWWRVTDARLQGKVAGRPAQVGWDRDEWDVALGDGALYRIYRDRDRDRWFVDGIVD